MYRLTALKLLGFYKSIDEFIFLLAYLGLPLGPEDLLTVLSVGCVQPDDKEKLYSMKCQSGDSSSAPCLARIIIAWCHAGRSSASRDLYAKLRQHSLPQLANHPVLLPEPQIRVPHLIRLPRELNQSDMEAHVSRHHAGYAFVLVLQAGALFLFFEQVELIIRLPEIYRDENGEPDPGMRYDLQSFPYMCAYIFAVNYLVYTSLGFIL
ncbi:unnamed protein product [Dibothriocephalus latus]|uniref:Uncharacterized protein n=1 Tax=Dibothriocephalus latus TaxID=60516 RepID=A0A3P7PS74_DIBLA|nr:unnamed protein product [Dibothriocephalus latus]